ncbi:hypothetical protein ACWCOY_37445, partial [Streptomyces tubercidicus]
MGAELRHGYFLDGRVVELKGSGAGGWLCAVGTRAVRGVGKAERRCAEELLEVRQIPRSLGGGSPMAGVVGRVDLGLGRGGTDDSFRVGITEALV